MKKKVEQQTSIQDLLDLIHRFLITLAFIILLDRIVVND
jgi:hypothetical protein